MDDRQIIETVMRRNIIDMALTFTAMMRVFSEGSKARISSKFEELCPQLMTVKSKDDYEQIHRSFCDWFVGEIRTAQRTLRNGKPKPSRPASYGHAAKVFDIALKVYVYSSGQPNLEAAARVTPFLHGAIDTPIMDYLKGKYSGSAITASTIEQIDRNQYFKLQELISKDIVGSFGRNILPVHYDDIMWSKLNRDRESSNESVRRIAKKPGSC